MILPKGKPGIQLTSKCKDLKTEEHQMLQKSWNAVSKDKTNRWHWRKNWSAGSTNLVSMFSILSPRSAWKMTLSFASMKLKKPHCHTSDLRSSEVTVKKAGRGQESLCLQRSGERVEKERIPAARIQQIKSLISFYYIRPDRWVHSQEEAVMWS